MNQTNRHSSYFITTILLVPVLFSCSGTDDELQSDFELPIQNSTGLPIVWIHTENDVQIESKEEYVNAFIRLFDADPSKTMILFEDSVQIKGHGNTTWKRFPKKPYRLKFKDGVSLLNEPADDSWVLLANYADKSMLRNDITFYLGSISALEYTPSSHFVELILNGDYQGTYQLTDKLKISANRVNAGQDGFLLEIDDYAPYETDARYFQVNHMLQPCVNIKDPVVEYDDDNFKYVKQFVLDSEEALFSDTFTDDEGWQKYMDIHSFADYYIITEITKNTDSMWGSSFMNLTRGGKLKMGPLWDYDLAYGNYSGNPEMADYEGFKVMGNAWYSRLFEDSAFVTEVKTRYDYFYSRKDDIAERLDSMAVYLNVSAQENNGKWDVLNRVEWPNVNAWGSYENEVQHLKEWLFNRMDWLKTQFDAL